MSHSVVYQPKDLQDALAWLASAPAGARCLAGGTDLMVLAHVQAPMPSQLLDLWRLDDLRGITEDADSLWLGALTTYSEMMTDPRVLAHLPLLAEAARSVGAAAIQNRGTLGGNIANASPAGDTLPVLLAHDAEFELASAKGRRCVAATRFYQGYKKLDMRPDELVARVRIPKQAAGERHLWLKVGQRRAQAISKVMLAARAMVNDGVISSVRLSLGSVAPTPVRLWGVERLLENQKLDTALAQRAGAVTCEEVSPISDVRSTVEYRRSVAGNIVARFVRVLAARAVV